MTTSLDVASTQLLGVLEAGDMPDTGHLVARGPHSKGLADLVYELMLTDASVGNSVTFADLMPMLAAKGEMECVYMNKPFKLTFYSVGKTGFYAVVNDVERDKSWQVTIQGRLGVMSVEKALAKYAEDFSLQATSSVEGIRCDARGLLGMAIRGLLRGFFNKPISLSVLNEQLGRRVLTDPDDREGASHVFHKQWL